MLSINKLTAIVFFTLAYKDCYSQEAELKVSLYYEALCPDCQEFIVEQLYPAYKLIGQYLNVELVPYGFTKASNASGRWYFTCQHGPKECYNNRVQSCAISLLDTPEALEYVNCIEKSRQCCKNVFRHCAESLNITYGPISKCVLSSMGDKAVVKNGEKTNAVIPPIESVPTILFNDTYNETNQNSAMTNFLKLACNLLDNKPDECKAGIYEWLLSFLNLFNISI